MKAIGGAALLLSLALASGHAKGVFPQGVPITIRVVNSSVVPVKSLGEAESIAGEIFAHAGVHVIWADPTDKSPADLRIYMVAGRQPHRSGDMTGYAVLMHRETGGESYAGILYQMVEAAANSQDFDVAYILGAAMAHEIGHLLLGAASHTAHGVMSARLGREQLRQLARGVLHFTPEQAGRIRNEIARRAGR